MARHASLSVILLSVGDWGALERALASIAGRCLRYDAEIIVVRQALNSDETTLRAAYPGVVFVGVPRGAGDAEMREVGMACATGDIVALRRDGAVGDGVWLDAFDNSVGVVDDGRPIPPPLEAEVLVPVAFDDEQLVADRRRGSDTGATVARGGQSPRSVILTAPPERDHAPTPVAHER